MAIVLASSSKSETWLQALHEAITGGYPDRPCWRWPLHDPAMRRAVDTAVVWRPEPGLWDGLPGLRCVFALGAGVEDLLAKVPAGVTLVRLIDPELTASMTEYVLLHVLRYHRHLDDYRAAQAAGTWRKLPQTRAADRTVGIVGLGTLGQAAALALCRLGFRVLGWSRTPKELPGTMSLAGTDGLDTLLAQSHIVVSLLPVTSQTRDFFHKGTFVRMRPDAYFINAGRGALVVEEDLIAALDAGHLAGATLDVFRAEPLPAGHPLWTHPKITVTPHIASLTDPRSAGEHIAANLRRFYAGEPVIGEVDRHRGY